MKSVVIIMYLSVLLQYCSEVCCYSTAVKCVVTVLLWSVLLQYCCEVNCYSTTVKCVVTSQTLGFLCVQLYAPIHRPDRAKLESGLIWSAPWHCPKVYCAVVQLRCFLQYSPDVCCSTAQYFLQYNTIFAAVEHNVCCSTDKCLLQYNTMFAEVQHNMFCSTTQYLLQ